MRPIRLLKNILAVVLPVILAALAMIQVQMCKNIFELRNSYLLESLPSTSERVWDALSGSLYPYLSLNKDSPSAIESNAVHPKNKPLMSSQISFKNLSQEIQQESANHYRGLVLQSGLPSLTVHYLWCVDGYFDMNQYVSILSILHQLRPDKIVIHYRIKPRFDPHGYWRWLEDLERDIVILSLKPLRDAHHCSNDLSSGVTMKHFSDPHGIFILGDVIIVNLTRPDVVKLIAKSFSKKNSKLSVQEHGSLDQSQVFIVPENEPFQISESPGHVFISCPTDTKFNTAKELTSVHCVSMQSFIAPDFLFRMESKYYNLLRMIMYGSPKPIDVSMGSSAQIPNIVHIILGDENVEVRPLLYLSIKSAYISGKVHTVFIHCHNKPSGELWDRLYFSDHLEPKWIPTAPFTKPTSEQAVKTYLLYTLLQHGGVATLGDIIFTKPVSSMPLRASAVVSPRKSQYRELHRSLNTDILVAAPGSDFIRDILGMIYQSQQSGGEAELNDIASHISEVNPKSVLIDSFLTSHQICQETQCMIAGGHDSPDMTYTTRLMWRNHKQPKSLREYLSIEGSSRNFFSRLI